MKVIEGGFGQQTPDEPDVTLKEALNNCLEIGEIDERVNGKFLLIVDTEERFTFMTNQKDLGALLVLNELVKDSIMTQVIHGTTPTTDEVS